jgi:flagellum-specific ATP synthase
MGQATDRLNPVNKLKRLNSVSTFRRTGRVAQIVGLIVESDGPPASLGELCWIDLPDGSHRAAEVVGFRDSRILLMPLGDLEGIGPGLTVRATGRPLAVPIASEALGRVLDGLGRPIDNKAPFICDEYRPLIALPPDPLKRERVTKPLPLGVRVIDAFMTCGMGQRIGIFGGSGVGKSSILGMFARYAKADMNVIALIGERGREVRDFIERDLGPEGLARSVVIVVTSDQPALLRIKGALTAASIAEFFRDQGANVLLMMDSVTRLCMAQREVGLAVGEPPTTRGYVPSVFSLLPRLLERSGMGEKGSVTGLYTVLVEGDDMNEPVADAVRSILDGHVVLSREMAAANHYPAVDVLQSQSRVFLDIVSPEHRKAAGQIRSLMAVHAKARDLLDVGAYLAGSNPEVDLALKVWPEIQAFLKQAPEEIAGYEAVVQGLRELAERK